MEMENRKRRVQYTEKQGYYLEHRFSYDYQGLKNHYCLIQIGPMIAQIIEAWEMLWKKVKQSRKQNTGFCSMRGKTVG